MDKQCFGMARGTVFSDPSWSVTRMSFLLEQTIRVVNRQPISAEM